MKKRIQKITGLMMVAVLMLGLLAGCGNQEQEQTEVPEATQNQEAAVTEENEYVYEYEQELNIPDDNYRNYYEIFVGSFYDSDADGMGDFNGITEKLDYIQNLGFNGIWLMPIMPSPSYHKYDTTDYKAVDEKYGTMEDFRNLVDECHKRDIHIIIDFVVNHSSNEHPWFKEACAYLKTLGPEEEPNVNECPYVDYYHFTKDSQGSGYASVSGTDWKYEAVFYYTQPDLNWSNESLRKEMEDCIDFWVTDVGIDGFRVDAAAHFEENDTAYNTEVLSWIYQACKARNPEFYMVSEVWSAKSTIASYYESDTDSMFNFDAAQAEGKIIKTVNNGNVKAFVESMAGYEEEFGSVYPDYIDAPFITNHDMVRVANSLMSDESKLKMAAGLLMTMNGSPFVYYGEEIGMKSFGKEDENKRLPMQWSVADSTGMTEGPVGCEKNVEYTFPAADEQLKDPMSLLNYYKRAIRIRNENPEIARGHIEIVSALCDGKYAAITKAYDESTIGIVYNAGEEEITLNLTDTVLSEMNIRGYLTTDGSVVTLEEKSLTLPARSICILK